MIKILKTFLITAIFLLSLNGQEKKNLVYVNVTGKLKWSATDQDAYFFGVNYAAPFAFAYRAIKSKGISVKDAIDLDVRQFKRLGLNAYRIHVWDREVSDAEGNLLENDHIEMLDYLISKLIENDIYIILTPIAWWGNGWPERDYPTPGFSNNFSKIESTTDPKALEIHKNYLEQFVNHKNRYTGKTYKDEQNIIAFELFNEPNLPADSAMVTFYINSLSDVLRKNGVTKPLFFNISENPYEKQWKGVAGSDVEGISFQWYPTGLVKNSEEEGNYLPNVMHYPLPGYSEKIKSKAKMVYEFDAADIGKSYMYPVMAQNFREAGMQWATMFCYDPTVIAQYNAEYGTHYLNLLYTPQKAIGFMIASELFRNPELADKVNDGISVRMNNVTADCENDLSILNSADKYYYSNNTDIRPENPSGITKIAGYGNSPLVEYSGRGAYFLDKVEADVWKLEIYPDAVWLKDPFGKTDLENPVAKLISRKHTMKIKIPGITSDFEIISNSANEIKNLTNDEIEIIPGTYLIRKKNNGQLLSSKNYDTDFEEINSLAEFISEFQSIEIKNLTPGVCKEKDSINIKIELYSLLEKVEVKAFIKKENWRGFSKIEMKRIDDFTYEAGIPSELCKNGILRYAVSVSGNAKSITFPGKLTVDPENWSFNSENTFSLSVLPESGKTILFSPERDEKNLIIANIWKYAEYESGVKFDSSGEKELQIKIAKMKSEFPELATQIYVGKYFKGKEKINGNQVEFEIGNISGITDSVEIRIINNNGTGIKRKVKINKEFGKIKIPTGNQEKIRFALMQRPYPVFLPYWYEASNQAENSRIPIHPEFIQIAFPVEKDSKSNYGIKLRKISLYE